MNKELLHKHINMYGTVEKKKIYITYYLEHNHNEYLIGVVQINNCIEVSDNISDVTTCDLTGELNYLINEFGKKTKDSELKLLVDRIIGRIE